MILPFSKYQGTGNDFILIDGLDEPFHDLAWEPVVKRLCDRHFGIGADGVALVLPSTMAAYRMVIYNADGTRPEMCGNGLRCFVRFLADNGLAPEGRFAVETDAGVLYPEVLADNRIAIDMGAPILERSRIPMLGSGANVLDEPLHAGDQLFLVSAVSMGNPHAVVFVLDAEAVPLADWGRRIEQHPSFPAKANVEFVQVLHRGEAKLRVWERGAGVTLACGTGACAALVAGVLTGRLEREAIIHMPGGDVTIAWPDGGHVTLTGPAEAVFTGEVVL